MYCGNCGKENKEGVRFCAFCGAKMPEMKQSVPEENENIIRQEQQVHFKGNCENVQKTGIGATDIILVIIYILLAVPWTDLFVSNFMLTKTAFTFIDEQNIAMGFYTLPYLLILAVVVIGIVNVFQQKYHISLGVAVIILSVILLIGKAVYSEISFDTVKLVAFRVFYVYGRLWIITLFFGIILTIFLYAKNAQKNGQGA